MAVLQKVICVFNTIPVKILMKFLIEIEKKYKTQVETQKSLSSLRNLEQKEYHLRYHSI